MGAGIDYESHVARMWVIDNFHKAEDAAGVERVSGRGPYGLRRQGVDAAKAAGIGPDGLTAAGGWRLHEDPQRDLR